MIIPLENKPALILKICSKSYLVIADLHIGFEEEFKRRGVILPVQTDRLLSELVSIIIENQPDELIILGDMKHQVPGISKTELLEIPRFLKELSSLIQITIIPGNHDGGLRELVVGIPHIRIANSRGILLNDEDPKIGLMHGHTWPAPQLLGAEIIILGHTHPVIELRDGLGYRYLEPVWVKIPLDRELLAEIFPSNINSEEINLRSVIVIPAFNKLLSGNSINKPDTDRPFLGPLLESEAALVDESEIFLLDGTYLGKLKILKELTLEETQNNA